MKLFKAKSKIQTTPPEYPAGVFLKTEKGFFYVYSTTQRYRFTTTRALESWAPQRVIEASENEPAVRKLKIISKMKFRNGSLLYSQANGSMYLVSENKLLHITNPDWLDWLGVSRRDAVWVSEEEIQLHQMGMTLD